MWSRRSIQGFSLVEAVFAAFLLLGAILMSVSIYDGTLKAEVGNEKRVRAALAAESVMARVRQSADTEFYNLATLYNNKTLTPADYPEFTARVRTRNARLAIPSTTMEQEQYKSTDPYPAPTGRFLDRSAVKVQVDITWDDGGARKLSMSENIVNLTPTTDFHVTLKDGTGAEIADGVVVSIPRRGKKAFSVTAQSEGQEVKDIQYTWYVEPLTGFGSVLWVSRDGIRCTYQNAYRTFSGILKDGPGACNLVVEATYQGVLSVDKVQIENEE